MSAKDIVPRRKYDIPVDVGGHIYNDPFLNYKNVDFGDSSFNKTVFSNRSKQKDTYSYIVKDFSSEASFLSPNINYQSSNGNIEIISEKSLTVNIKYSSLNEKHDENEIKIEECLNFLNNELFGTENEKRYEETKALLREILERIDYKKYPFIGVDDDGQIGAEWHDGLDYKIVSITPVNEKKILINCVKSIESIIKIQTTLENIKKYSNKELMINI
jgi:hypothetical protein